MAAKFYIYSAESAIATEIYITATPDAGLSLEDQAKEIYSKIARILKEKNAQLFMERIFATSDVTRQVNDIRLKEYDSLDDGVLPAFLVCKPSGTGSFAGVQVHAIISDQPLEIFDIEDKLSGRFFGTDKCKYLSISGLSVPQLDNPSDQAGKMFDLTEQALEKFGGDYHCVPRTWMWLGDILSWYDDFNAVRSKFFVERGLLGENSTQSMPASTGIGLGPDDGGACSMDLTAAIEPREIEYLQAGGKQQCAFEYGSAFSRASRAITPAGETVFVSGTAAINAAGITTNIGKPKEQIEDTITNVQAVLRDMNCSDDEVVQVMAYCKTSEVEKVFNQMAEKPDWPWVTMICDVCRDNLLFEIELIALPRKQL